MFPELQTFGDCQQDSQRRLANTAQKLALRHLRERLALDEATWRTLLAPFGVRSAHNLEFGDAQRLMEALLLECRSREDSSNDY